jgi:TolB-like protein/Tfp pilus assembly protein PilF
MSADSPKTSITSGSDVFVSYASPDAAIANVIVENLEQHGIRCWMAPRDVKPGTVYADAIIRAINEAKALVLVLSASAMASEHVSREVERAGSKHKQIVVFRVDAVALSAELEYFLSRSQWIDAAALGMPASLSKLTEAVHQGSAKPSSFNPGSSNEDNSGRAAVHHAVGTGTAAKRVAVTAVVVIVLLGVAAILAVRFGPSKHGDAQVPPVAAVSDKSIAVLPFADMSQKKDQEYFGDGMAEEILDLLAKIPGLTVIGRTSSFQFKGKNEDLRTIGTKLNAAYVLEGSVRNSGDQVRITAQLINTRSGAHEWSETYDRPFDDVLKLQDAIAAAVARELQLTVAFEYLQPRTTLKDAAVYELLLRGRHAFDRFDNDGFAKAATLFQRALDRDPTSADAAAELAFSYEAQGEWGFLAPTAAFEQARRLTATALRLDPTNARAHYVLGFLHTVYDWDWPAAEREFQRVAALAPGSADGLIGQALVSRTLGRWDDALREIKAGIAQDPLSPDGFSILMKIQWSRGNLPEAEAAARRVLDIRPTYGDGHFYLGLVLLARGDREAALREMQQETSDNAQQEGLAIAYHALGRRAESDAALARMLKQQADEDAVGIAEVYAFRGQPDEAMQWLDRAYAQKDVGLYRININLPLKSLEADPRFKAFLRKMNLPE